MPVPSPGSDPSASGFFRGRGLARSMRPHRLRAGVRGRRGSPRAWSTVAERLEPRSMLAVDVLGLGSAAAIEPAAADTADDGHDHGDDGHVDADGNRYCVLPVLPREMVTSSDPFANAPLQAPLADTFKLHSRPSATKVIYLDFNGHTTSNTPWNQGIGSFFTPAYDLDGQSGFSDAELTNIQNIFARVVEDYSPFDVDVTTEEPALEDLRKSGTGDTRWGVRVAIGGSYLDWFKQPAGGVAYLTSFTWDTDTPCYVFGGDYGTFSKGIAEAVSHEVGHTLGLTHDGRITPAEGYYYGHGSGPTGWAPIMGVGYDRELVQWSKGEYTSANNKQDDLQIITTQNGFDYRVDDYGGTVATAFTPKVTAGTSISLAGVIERNTDVDVFRFTTIGPLKATLRPADISPNLDILAEVWDEGGSVLATSNPTAALDASFDLTVGTGTYYLAISGTGKGDPLGTGYTKYASLGQYTVSMTIQSDVTPPDPPTILSVTDDVGAVTGQVPSGGSTDDATLALAGTAEPQSTVTIFDGTVQLGTVTADAGGGWSFVTPALAAGPHAFTATATDDATNTSAPSSPAWRVVVDLTPPPAPAIRQVIDDAAPQTGVVPSGGSTNDATPTLVGTAEPGATVTVLDGTAPIGTVVADGSGNWTLAVAALAPGKHSFTAKATDAAGLTGPASSPYEITVDAVAPLRPSIVAVLQSGDGGTVNVPNGGRTSDATPTLSGIAEAASTITVFEGDTPLGTAVTDATGRWSFTTSALVEGPHTFTATATDLAGNTSIRSAGYTVTIDLTAPAAPALLQVVSDLPPQAGVIPNGGRTNDRTLLISGTGPAQTIVRVLSGDTQVGSTTTDAGGAWTLATNSLGDATYALQAVSVDDVGNVSSKSMPAYVVTVDTRAPDAPSIRRIIDDVAPRTGEVANGGGTNDTSPVLSGAAEPGVTVWIRDGGVAIGSVQADGGGGWTFAPTGLTEGQHTFTAVGVDATGNVGQASQPFDVTIDTATPAAPTIGGVARTAAAGAAPVASGSRIREAILVISGTAEPRGSVTVLDAGVVVGTATVDAAGLWSVTTGILPEGGRSFAAVAVDAAGNPSQPSAPPFVVVIDTTPPAAPRITGVIDDVTPNVGDVPSGGSTNDRALLVAGTADPLTVVRVFGNGQLVGSGTADALGGWAITTLPLGEGWCRLVATSVDDLGNESPASATERVVLVDSLTAVPAIDSVGDDVDPATGSVPNGGSTNDPSLALAGSAEPGALVTVWNGTVVIGTATADGQGRWRLVTSLLAAGTYAFTASAIDPVGNASGMSSPPLVVTIDLTAPAAPTIAAVVDESVVPARSVPSGGACRGTQLRLSGTAEPGAAVVVANGGTPVGTVTADAATGVWTLLVTGGGNGVRSFTAAARDAAANLGPASAPYVVTVDSVPPAVPVIRGIFDDVEATTGRVSGGGVTNDASPLFVGTGEPGSLVTIFDGDSPIGSVTADAGGAWSFTPSSLADGQHSFTAAASDTAGNQTARSAPPYLLRVDGVAPVVVGFLATAATGRFGVGGRIEIAARLSEPVAAGSVIEVRFDTGATTRLQAPTQGATLVGTLVVAAGENSEKLRVVGFDAGRVADLAGNPLALTPAPAGVIEGGAIAVDTASPRLEGFSSPTPDGRYEAGQSIELVAQFSEPVAAGSAVQVTLNTGAQVLLKAATAGTQLTGTLVVEVGQRAAPLAVSSYTFVSGAILDLVGNPLASTAMPEPAGTLATRGIVVDGALKVAAAGMSTEARTSPNRKGSVTVVPLTFSAPVVGLKVAALRVLFNGRSVSLAGATLTGSGASYTLRLPARITAGKGLYTLQILPGYGIAAESNASPLTQPLQLFWGNGRGITAAPTPKALAFVRR